MDTGAIFIRILIDGSILTVLASALLVGTLYFDPRLALSDYPEDVKAAVPPRTKKELRLGILLSIPFLLMLLAIPLYSTWRVAQDCGCGLSYGVAFLIIFGELLIFFLFDLLVLDLWMFYTVTPKFLVLPGTEGFAGYKDFRPHMKSQLTWGLLMTAVFSALLALIPWLFF